MIWITGAAGSVGQALKDKHPLAVTSDLEVDVTDWFAVARFTAQHSPISVFHCAGAKHAPEGETDPGHVADVNIDGTRNVLAAVSGRVVLASTCKAADPETAYGASKLIAERMVLNAGGTVARFYNVRETSGNVFEIWRNTDGPLPVMACWRYFISLDQAVTLMEACATLPTGRYTIDPGEPVYIPDLADELYPDREKKMVEPRRGDRVREPLKANHETISDIGGGILQIHGPHDPC